MNEEIDKLVEKYKLTQSEFEHIQQDIISEATEGILSVANPVVIIAGA